MLIFMFMNVFSQQQLKIPGASSTIQPVNNNCGFIALSIYSCATNVSLEMTSVRHQINNDLHLVIVKKSINTTARVSRWLFFSTNPTILLQICDV